MAMQVRATQASIAARVMGGLQHNLNRMGQLQEQLSSGKLINRPSDSPAGGEAITRGNAELTRRALTTQAALDATRTHFQRPGSNYSTSHLTPGITRRDGP